MSSTNFLGQFRRQKLLFSSGVGVTTPTCELRFFLELATSKFISLKIAGSEVLR